jgi:hypothetical protein
MDHAFSVEQIRQVTAPKKVALAACMRKRLTILNAINEGEHDVADQSTRVRLTFKRVAIVRTMLRYIQMRSRPSQATTRIVSPARSASASHSCGSHC